MPIAVAELKQETNTLAPRLTTRADFESWHLWHGQSAIDGSRDTNVEIEDKVVFAGLARFRFEGGGYTGVEMDIGPCAVVKCGNVHISLVSRAILTVDPAFYRAVGIEPKDFQIVVVKSHIQFRAGHDEFAKGIILLDSPGMSRDHLESLIFSKAERPLFPFDREMTWTPAATGPGEIE